MPRTKATETSAGAYDDSMSQDSYNPNCPEETGLFLVGKVADRVKKKVTAQDIEVEVVTYTVMSDSVHRYFVDDFNPEKYYKVGENVSLPVYVKAYKKKTGEASYMLKLMKKEVVITSRGEHF